MVDSDKTSPDFDSPLSAEARACFIKTMVTGLTKVSNALHDRLLELTEKLGTTREMYAAQDAWRDWQKHGHEWQKTTADSWVRALDPQPITAIARLDIMGLELVGDDVLENKIIASQMAQALTEKTSIELNDLRGRLKKIDPQFDQVTQDVIRPEVLVQLLIEQWMNTGLSRVSLQAVSLFLSQELANQLKAACTATSIFLQEKGIAIDEDDLRSRVRRTPVAPAQQGGRFAPTNLQSMNTMWSNSSPMVLTDGMGGIQTGHFVSSNGQQFIAPIQSAGNVQMVTADYNAPSSLPANHQNVTSVDQLAPQQVLQQLHRFLMPANVIQGALPHGAASGGVVIDASAVGGAGTANLVAGSGVTAMNVGATVANAAAVLSPGLAQALMLVTPVNSGYMQNVVANPQGIVQVINDIRQQTTELKKTTPDPSEKATIEIIALMFQSILSEDRIPSSIRVWFSRLQVPVLRLALVEPDFFESASHPARMLLDRMGSCVLGFDPSAMANQALEAEIRRAVQVIEQYPETGRRVFQLVLDEFQQFLAKFLTTDTQAQKLVNVAQQLEQKETLVIQYTIEMRHLLEDMPVREEVRQFIFKVWAEALAVSAVRLGPKHPETLELKKAAADLLWATGAKLERTERMRMIHELPALLEKIRHGMALVGATLEQQEEQISQLSAILADAFLSKTESIDQEKIDTLVQALANLEDYVSEEGLNDLSLDAANLEDLLEISDDAHLHVVVHDRKKSKQSPKTPNIELTKNLRIGQWFQLNHNSNLVQVQYVWHSVHQQLHLFSSMNNNYYLLQLNCLALHLETALIKPLEKEFLTIRASREALAKLGAQPERLLN